MVAEFGAPLVAAMAGIKRALDPLGIMNPGKVLPETEIADWKTPWTLSSIEKSPL
jgi:hypothetical protein